MDNASARIRGLRRWSRAGSLLRVVDGQDTPPKRPAPHLSGPLGSSGAAPEDPPTAPGKAAEEQAAGSTDKPAAEAADKTGPASKPRAGSADKPEAADKPGSVDKPAAEAATKPGPTGKPVAEAAGGTGGSPTGKAADDPAKLATEKLAEKSSDRPGEDKPGEDKPGEDKLGQDKPSGEKPDGKQPSEPGAASKKPEDKPGDKRPDGRPAPSAAAVALASRDRATRVLRRANPARVVRSTSEWAKRPSGRFILPAIIAVLLLGAAGTAGAYLVPQALESVPTPSATPGFGLDAQAPSAPLPSVSGLPSLPGLTSAPAPPLGGLPTTAPAGVVGGARPADVLSGWAQQTGTRVGIPVVAVQAYGYAELVVGRTAPSCHLSWTTLAAIAKVESAHGSANGAVLGVDGAVAPAIFGLPLDGKGGRQLIRDTDQGVLDKDNQYDRAMGPLQFIPQTWNEISTGNAVDADNNGVSDPNDIDDAALAAAVYLCRGGRDLSKADAWWDAILSYNAVRPYAQKVFDAANEYGQRSRV